MARREPWQERFWRHAEKTPTCWLWRGAQNSFGYGSFYKRHGRATMAHRAAWELTNGVVPPCLYVLHICDVRHCVNPDHLFLGTKGDNARDRDAKGRNAKGERINNSKLTAAQVLDIRARHTRRYGSGITLMREFGLSRSGFDAIVNGLTWKHLGG